MTENQRQSTKKRSSAQLATILIILLVGFLYLGWNYLSGTLPWQHPSEGDKPEITWLGKDTGEQETVTTEEKAGMPQEQESVHMALDEKEISPAPQDECLQTADKITLFFEHLDRQAYIHEHVTKGSTLDHFRGIINKLIANPPVVIRETDDLFAILNNMAHFFRILGPKDILLIKDIFIHERDLIEPTMALFYKWSEIAPNCSDSDLNIDLPLPGLYEYAGYFINTLGGQSYLFRRELYLRILIRYYSILIIDRANQVNANRYGIDIRYTLDSLIPEIQGNSDLENKQAYLENLAKLQEHYQAKYGSN
jgi:hypothetical protein